jgi:hypothetical protein
VREAGRAAPAPRGGRGRRAGRRAAAAGAAAAAAAAGEPPTASRRRRRPPAPAPSHPCGAGPIPSPPSPRAPAELPRYSKINGRLADPDTGRRLRGRGRSGGRRGPVNRVSFGAFVLTAIAGWRAFQLLSRALFNRGQKQRRARGADGALVEWASDDEEEEEQPLPPLVRGRAALGARRGASVCVVPGLTPAPGARC